MLCLQICVNWRSRQLPALQTMEMPLDGAKYGWLLNLQTLTHTIKIRIWLQIAIENLHLHMEENNKTAPSNQAIERKPTAAKLHNQIHKTEHFVQQVHVAYTWKVFDLRSVLTFWLNLQFSILHTSYHVCEKWKGN